MISEYRLVVRDDPKSPAAEAIRSLRTNLQYVGLDRPLKSVMVTSAGPAEGKTSISANLAASIAESGVKTIAVGVDLRKPSLHKALERSNTVGLTNVLLGQIPLKDALQETEIENLRLLSSGPIPPNPAELLGSKAMQHLIQEIAGMCDVAIYDSTPVVSVTDAVLLGRYMDGTILVVSMNLTPREIVKRAKEQLEQVKAPVLGIVANRVSPGSDNSYYYYYGDYGATEAAASGVGGASGRRASGVKRLLARLVGGR